MCVFFNCFATEDQSSVFSSEEAREAYRESFGLSGIKNLKTIQQKISQLGFTIAYRTKTKDFVVRKSSALTVRALERGVESNENEYVGNRIPKVKRERDSEGNLVFSFIPDPLFLASYSSQNEGGSSEKGYSIVTEQ